MTLMLSPHCKCLQSFLIVSNMNQYRDDKSGKLQIKFQNYISATSLND